MKKNYVVFGTYNSLPEGAEESTFEYYYQNAYRPFLSVLYRFPDVSASVFFSGSLIDWFERRHPEFNMLIDELVGRKQLELLGGPYFSPLLPLIPNADRLGQIEYLTTTLRKRFGKRPRGCWVPSYAWEAGLVTVLQTCGMDYAFLPIDAFGAKKSELPVISEDQGKTIVVFPVRDPGENEDSPDPLVLAKALVERFGGSQDADREVSITMFRGESLVDVWEKAGLETPDIYYEELFALVRKNILLFETLTPSRYLKTMKHFERTYFPAWLSAGLRKLHEPDGRATPFSCCARSILEVKSESFELYARMQHVYMQVNQLKGDKSRKKSAQEALWRAQTGEAYACGASNSVEAIMTRTTALSALIEAERTSRQKGGFLPGVINADLNFDGEREYAVQGKDMSAFLLAQGACVTELDSLLVKRPVLSTITGASPSFYDRFHAAGSSLEEMVAERPQDLASFSTSPYAAREMKRGESVLTFARDGALHPDGKRFQLGLEKEITLRHNAFSLRTSIRNKSQDRLEFVFSSEWTLTVGARMKNLILARDGEELPFAQARVEGQKVSIVDKKAGTRISVRCSAPFALVPVVIGQGPEARIFKAQADPFVSGIRCVPALEVSIDPEQAASFEAEISVELFDQGGS